MPEVVCSSCGHKYTNTVGMYVCKDCSGALDLADIPILNKKLLDKSLSGVWRYRHVLPLSENCTPVTLGEGGTPLVSSMVQGRQIHFKLEFLNPTGSFKDRGTTVMVTHLANAGVEEAVEDSSGNAGASFAAYAASAGIRAYIYTPESASGPKCRQIMHYGANLIKVRGPRSSASDAVLREVKKGAIYASHVFDPIGLSGLTTTAFEIWETMLEAPDWIVLPVGHGTNLLGIARGNKILKESGLISKLPHLVGVQASAIAPLYWIRQGRILDPERVAEGDTMAEGIRIERPVRKEAVLNAITESDGDIFKTDEAMIIQGMESLARLGFYVEATSAVVWDGLLKVMEMAGKNDTIVVILTGSGLKTEIDTSTTTCYHDSGDSRRARLDGGGHRGD